MEKLQTKTSFDRIRLRMYGAHHSFLLFKALHFARATDLHQTEICERNQRVLTRHNDFFFGVKKALHQAYIVDLAIFFDKTKSSLNYRELLTQLKQRVDHKVYESVCVEVQSKIQQNSAGITFIQNLRNDIAHEAKNKDQELMVELAEIEKLLSLTQDIFNLMSHHFDSSKTIFDKFEEIDHSTIQTLLHELDLGHQKFVEQIKANNNLT